MTTATAHWHDAVDFLASRYPSTRVDVPEASPYGDVRRVEALNADGRVCAVWLIRDDGIVDAAWDPDRHLEGYLRSAAA